MTGPHIDPSSDEPGACAPSLLFHLLWVALCDVLGSPATATLMRRSSLRASVRQPGLAELTIKREQFQYSYLLPDGWNLETAETFAALRALMSELRPLLIEMTGEVVMARLSAIPELQRCRLLAADGSVARGVE